MRDFKKITGWFQWGYLTRGVLRGPVCKMSAWCSESLRPALHRAVTDMTVNDTLITQTNSRILHRGSKKAAEKKKQIWAPTPLWTVFHQKRVRTADELPAHTEVSVCVSGVCGVCELSVCEASSACAQPELACFTSLQYWCWTRSWTHPLPFQRGEASPAAPANNYNFIL